MTQVDSGSQVQARPGLLPLLLFFTIFLTVFILYSLSLAPGVVGGDAGEHQLAVPLLGIPHTTGYPLYVLIGKLWTLIIPIGSMAWRLNLFSCLWRGSRGRSDSRDCLSTLRRCAAAKSRRLVVGRSAGSRHQSMAIWSDPVAVEYSGRSSLVQYFLSLPC